MLSPFECLCGNFILPEPASYVFFYAVFNLRNLFYLIVPGVLSALLLCVAKQDTSSEIMEITHAEAYTFQDFRFVVAAFDEAV